MEILNLELNELTLVLKAMNRNRSLKEAAYDLDISLRQIYILVEKYDIKKVDGKYTCQKEVSVVVVFSGE